ncbi:hypothetical protein B9Z55_026752 [Caenorhabditis nigoni]|uniref:Uncharacterized protein n=1 Tax=Caenorhabditis nigoni TaxID=1611254 RepID=A0A2G5SHS9_9PELO|nr:hypothetical protein B9Z55_026752 [Caenorhabditis nigoni]
MGYVETKCMATGEEVHSYAFYTTNKDEIFGEPGSLCTPGRKGTSDGLCALEKSYGRKVVSRSIWKDSGFPPIGIVPPPFKNKDYNPITKSREDYIPVFERTKEEEGWENWGK